MINDKLTKELQEQITDNKSNINELDDKIKNIGKLLWKGSFTSGSITIDGISGYKFIMVDVGGCWCIGNLNYGGGSVGAYGSYSATEYTYRFGVDGDTLIINNENRGGSNGSANQPIREIYGIF